MMNTFSTAARKKSSLFILGLTALLCSRTMLVSLDDPEGPNLLIIVVLAMILYLTALPAYLFDTTTTDTVRLLRTITLQAVLVASLFFLLS